MVKAIIIAEFDRDIEHLPVMVMYDWWLDKSGAEYNITNVRVYVGQPSGGFTYDYSTHTKEVTLNKNHHPENGLVESVQNVLEERGYTVKKEDDRKIVYELSQDSQT